MTSQTRSTNTTNMSDGKTITGTNFRDIIDSYVSLIDSTAQSISSNLTVPTLIVTTVCAGSVFADNLITSAASYSGVVSANAGLVVSGAVKISGITSATDVYANNFFTSGHSKLGSVSACDVFFDTVTCSGAMHIRGHVSAKAGISVSGGIDFSTVSAKTLFVADASADSSAATTLTVHGPSVFHSLVSADAGITVSGAAQFNGILSAASVFADTLVISGITSAGATFADSLTISGITSAANLFADNITDAGTLKVAGITSAAALFADSLTISGITSAGATFADSLTISGITTLAGANKLTGITSAAALFAGNTSIDGTLKITGITSAGTLYVDNLISINDARGHMHISSAGATATNVSAGITNTFIDIKATVTADTLVDVTRLTTGRLTYTGAITKEFLIILNVSVSSATNNHDFQIALAKNGTVVAGSEIETRVGAAGSSILSLGTTEMMSLAQNDYVTIQMASDTASINTIHKLNLSMTQI